MRFLSLELEKFGAFEGLHLTFRPNARLHVVYGPNGAGKSTTLAAVGALLFGVPHKTPYDFRFEGRDLRIGAEVADRVGRSLRLRRRKGNKSTLLDAADKPLPEDALVPFLGAVDEEVFRRSFGLDAARLRAGGEAMLQADGDLGESLMAAASGLRGLRDLRRRIDAEAEQIFAPRAAKDRRFYQALERFDTARKAIRDSELRIEVWKKLNADIDELGAKLDWIRAERRANAAEQSRLHRLKRVAPVLRDIADDELRLASYCDLPDLAPGATQQLRKAIDERNEAAKDGQRAREDEATLAEELTGVEVSEAILSEAATIADLFQASGGYANEKRDLPRIQADADGLRGALDGHARALGLRDSSLLQGAQPTAAALADLRRLISQGREREAARATWAGRLSQERKEFEALRLARDGQGAAIDPGPLRERFSALGKVGEQARRLADSGVALVVESQEVAEAAARTRSAGRRSQGAGQNAGAGRRRHRSIREGFRASRA